MASSSGEPGEVIVGINITPLVDVVLVLLIIFIVTAKIIVTPAVPMDLPRSAAAETVQVVFAVQIPAHGGMVVDGQAAADDATLRRLAEHALTRDSGTTAVIHADGDVAHRRIIHVIDVLRGAGMHKIAFGVAPEGPP